MEHFKMQDKPKNRYYLWELPLSEAYGWRQAGRNDGYATLAELKKDCEYHFREGVNRETSIMWARAFK